MSSIIAGLFFILHGLVYLLYAGQSRRLFELRPGLAWPDGSWAFSKLLGDEATRSLATGAYALIALGFVACGIGLIARQSWWRPGALGTAAVASLLILLLWDGKWELLDAKGGIGLLINLGILAALVLLR